MNFHLLASEVRVSISSKKSAECFHFIATKNGRGKKKELPVNRTRTGTFCKANGSLAKWGSRVISNKVSRSTWNTETQKPPCQGLLRFNYVLWICVRNNVTLTFFYIVKFLQKIVLHSSALGPTPHAFWTHCDLKSGPSLHS